MTTQLAELATIGSRDDILERASAPVKPDDKWSSSYLMEDLAYKRTGARARAELSNYDFKERYDDNASRKNYLI